MKTRIAVVRCECREVERSLWERTLVSRNLFRFQVAHNQVSNLTSTYVATKSSRLARYFSYAHCAYFNFRVSRC